MNNYTIHILVNLRHLTNAGLLVSFITLIGLGALSFVIMIDPDLKKPRYWCKILLVGDAILLLICILGFIFLP